MLGALTAGALTACLGELASPRGVTGEATLSLGGLRSRQQTAGDTTSEVQAARFAVYLLLGSTRREVASRLFTAKDLDVADTDSGTTFKMSFPYTSPDDRFEVEGRGMSALGDTLYKVGPVRFTMRSATSAGAQAAVSVTAPPVYVGPGATAVKVVIAPRTLGTSQGKSASVTAALYDAAGKALTSPTFRFYWWSADPSVARFNDGRVSVLTGGDRPGATWIHVVFDPMELRDSVLVTNTVPPAQLKVVNGSGQTGALGQTLFNPVAVQVLTSTGIPVPGVTVSFAVSAGGGTLSATSRVTGSPEGVASVIWTLGQTIGDHSVTASVPGLPSVGIGATAVPKSTPTFSGALTVSPTAIQAGGEEAVVTATLLQGGAGSPLVGVPVSFSGPAWATFSAVSAVTDAKGMATTRVRASQAGRMTIAASFAGVIIGTVDLDVSQRMGLQSP